MQKLGLKTLAASAGMLASGVAANAQFFNYASTFLPNPIPSSSPNTFINVTNGFNNGGVFAGASGTDITVSNFTTSSSDAISSPGTFNTTNTVTITLQQSSSGGATTGSPLSNTFRVLLTGTGSVDAVDTTATFLDVIKTYNFGPGQNIFTVALTNYVSPGPPGSPTAGALGAHVNGSIALSSTPEPGAIAMLAGMGVPGLLFVRRLRRR